jgi:hypothetical protein
MAGLRFDLTALRAQAVASPDKVSEQAVSEPAPAFASVVDNRAVSGKTQVADVDKKSPHVASRLDGLRNLVTVLRPKQMKTTEVPHQPMPAPASASMAAVSPELEMARPESHPPEPIVDSSTSGKSAESAASNRPDRAVRVEEVAILPSRPGQYKRK